LVAFHSRAGCSSRSPPVTLLLVNRHGEGAECGTCVDCLRSVHRRLEIVLRSRSRPGGLSANEARLLTRIQVHHIFTVSPASDGTETLGWFEPASRRTERRHTFSRPRPLEGDLLDVTVVGGLRVYASAVSQVSTASRTGTRRALIARVKLRRHWSSGKLAVTLQFCAPEVPSWPA